MSSLLELLAILGGLVTLDILAMRYGYDSRDGMRPDGPIASARRTDT